MYAQQIMQLHAQPNLNCIHADVCLYLWWLREPSVQIQHDAMLQLARSAKVGSGKPSQDKSNPEGRSWQTS